MLRPKYQHDHPQRGERGGSISSRDTGDTVSSSVCYDAMSSFNVTVSLQPKSPARPASSQNAGAERSGAPLSLGSASIGSQSFGSISTTVSQPQSLTESIGSFDAEKVQIEAQKALAGSGLLSGDMSAAFPESVERAEEVLRHTREVLARADANSGGGGVCDQGREPLTTEDLEGLSRALKRALFVCPNHRGLHAMRGEVHRRLQDFRTAVGSLRLAVRMDKSELHVRQRLAEVLLSQGMVWLDGGDYEPALACFEEACTVDGANASVHFCRTVALVKLGRFGEALRAMEAVLGRRRGTVDDFVLRAKIRWAVGMVGPGNQDMSTAKTLRSDHPEVVMFGRRCLGESAGLYVKAKAFADAGNDQMAIKVLNQVAELTPEDVKVLIVRAACKRRMKDFVGALRDYDESSFKHFEGVHIGRRALDQAAGRLRDSRGEGARRRDVAAAAGSAGSAGSAAGAGERGGGEEARARGEVELVPASLGAEGGGGGNAVGVVGASSILEGARLEEPPVGGEAAAAAEGWRTGAGRAAGGGSGVEPAHPDAASLSLPPRSDGGVGVGGSTGARIAASVADREKIEEGIEAQADDERGAKAELRLRFRLAIPHAGLDPAYSLRPPASRLRQHLPHQEQRLPRPQQQQQQQQQQQRPPQERGSLSFSSSISSSSQISAGVPPASIRRAEGGLLSSITGREGGGAEERRGERWPEQQQQQQQQGGEGYTEPAYITRQRCLVLNDWALSLFETGEYAKAVMALNLAIEGDKAFASVTGGAMESKFFLNRGDCYRASGASELAVRDYKLALEVEPGNWTVKTRLSLAHYLKGNCLFNDGDFLGAKAELDTAIAYNWKISAYFLLRGHALYYGGFISDAHADYQKALQLDPGNVEAQRLCRQFDSEGKLVTVPNTNGRGETSTTAAEPSPSGTERLKRSALPLPSLPTRSSPASCCARPPPSRPAALGSPATTSSSAGSAATKSACCPCRHCGASAGGGGGGGGGGLTMEPSRTDSRLPVTGRSFTGGAIRGVGGCSQRQKLHRPALGRRRRRRPRAGGKRLLPVVDTRPPKQPEWKDRAMSWVKAGESGVRRVFDERSGGVPARNECLWAMLSPVPRRGWSTAAGAPAKRGGSESISST